MTAMIRSFCQRLRRPGLALPLLVLLATAPCMHSQVLDAWRASDLNIFDDGDAVGTWASTGNRTAASTGGGEPVLRKDATPGGSSVVRFNRNWLTVANSPVAGLTSFSIALVFKASAVGTNGGIGWYNKSGIIDADESGVAADWGLAIDERGRLAFGSGQPDITTTIAGNSLVDSNYHAAVITWGGGSQTVYMDDRPIARRSTGASVLPRGNAGFSIGAVHNSDGATGRRFVGDLAELRFYGTSLSPADATNVIQELRIAHLQPNLPVFRLFASSTNSIYEGESVTLTWDVTNHTSLSLSPGDIPLSGPTGSITVTPAATTTYILTATNELGSRSASVNVFVDPGIPVAHPQSVATIRNASRAIELTGTDPNGGQLTYAILAAPSSGTLSGVPPGVVYQPATDFSGSDSFTFVVRDGSHESAPATISVRVDPLPTPPSRVVASSTNLFHPLPAGAFLAALRTLDANPLDSHTYALVDGAGARDNAWFELVGNQLRAAQSLTAQSPPILLLRVRTTDSAGLSLEQPLAFRVGPVTSLPVINEIHYNGATNTVREEFVELYNPRDAAVDLAGWRLQGGVDYLFPHGSVIPPRGFLVVAEDPATLKAVYAADAIGPWVGSLNGDGEELSLRDARGALVDQVDYRSEFPWPVAANGGGGSIELVNPTADNNLGGSWRSALSPARPSPGMTNRSYLQNPPPNLRQVDHSPRSPASGDPVRLTVKVTDSEGVGAVVLEYQVVAPGSFIPSVLPLTFSELNATPFKTPRPNPAYQSNWVSVVMRDDGLAGDAEAGDDIYTTVLPPEANRSLVRYRITATDTFGASRRAPFEDDEALNFAYFVYDGVPDYFGTPAAALETLPVYHLITRPKDLLDCNGYDGIPQLDQFSGNVANEARYIFNWPGALVYDGEVYDHIRYRLRGANGRYQPGKRNMRFKFTDGRHFQARDQAGRKYPTKWSSLTTGKGSSNRLTLTYGLNELLNYFLWNLVGVPSPGSHYFHFRVVQGAAEAPDAYNGDFWGLSWAQENYDVRFLEAHDLPKGNLYKLINAPRSEDVLVDQQRQERYQAPFAVANSQDAFNIQQRLNATQTASWLQAHVNYSNWYRFHAIAEAIRHYDYWPSANKNAAWYFEPVYTPENGNLGRMWTLPWDTDSTWGPTWNSGIDAPYNAIGAFEGGGTRKPEMLLEYTNVVREVRDLLFQPDQIMPLIDAFASQISAFVPADLRRWSNAPSASNPKTTSDAAYRTLPDAGPGLSAGLAGYVADMKRFAFTGGSWPGGDVGVGGQGAYLDLLTADPSIPTRPTVTFVGPPGHPLDSLRFRSSAFADPQGPGTFAAMKWRVAEIRGTNEPVVTPDRLPLEWNAAWESGELPLFKDEILIPGAYLKAGQRYRVRVAHKDLTGRWSRWSTPSEFIPSPADVLGEVSVNLVISELMYHPSAPGEPDEDAFEFLEFQNLGITALDLSGVRMTGITYTFPNGSVLEPGARWLLVRDPAAFARRYPEVAFQGVYQGKLDNGGESLQWIHPTGVVLGSLSYGDRAPWPVTADGYGFSLVLVDPLTKTYRGSTQPGGSPGAGDPPSPIPAVVVEEILASPKAGEPDAIEIHNPTDQPADVSGWWLSDDATIPKKFRIPPGSVLAPNGYLRFTEGQFNPQPATGAGFLLSSIGESVYLFSASGDGSLTGYSHGWAFGGSPDERSIGRHVNSAGDESFPPQLRNTLGSANAGPEVGPVILSEIHYHPQSPDDEFIELVNRTLAPVDLFDPAFPTNRWRMAGVDFVFPPGSRLNAGQYLLLVKAEPSIFRARHAVPADVIVLGPYAGALQGDGELLELQSPAKPTQGGVPYYAQDQVRYRDSLPWPLQADGSGASLHRVASGSYGSEPDNWRAALPSPGSGWTAGAAPTILRAPAGTTAIAGQGASFTVQAAGPGPLSYQWRFQGRVLPGATHPVLTLVTTSLADDGDYSVDVVNPFGSARSTAARLGVILPPRILVQPQDVFGRPGTNVAFSVVADSTTALQYQWERDGIALPGAVGSTLELPQVDVPQQGRYRVRVTDAIGTVVSQPASLVLLIDPVIVQDPVGGVTVPGGSVTFSVEVTNTATLPITYRWRRGTTEISGGNFTLNQRTAFMTVTNVTGSLTNFSVTVSNLARKTVLISKTATVTLLTDTDRDGIPDVLETQWGLDPGVVADGALDLDGDRMSNFSEFVSGTDPRDAASVLAMRWGPAVGGESGIGAVLEFEAIAGRTYTVESSVDVAAPVWTRVVDVPARPATRWERIPDPGAGAKTFYRVVTPRRP